METSFYHDSNMRNNEAVKKMKSTMSLDFGAAPTKKRATQTSNLLNSPDLNLLKLASPELERLIIQQSNGMVTTTPTPTQFINPKFVTEEQEEYARGFVNALTKLHETDGPHHGDIPMSTADDVIVSGAPVTSLTTMMSSNNMNMNDISSSNAMITSVPVSSVMSTSCYQSQVQQMGSMTYTTACTTMLPPASHILPVSSADLMPVTSQQQYTTLMPPTSQAQQQQQQQPQQQQPQMFNLPVQQEQDRVDRVLQLKQEESQIVPNLGLSPPMSPINLEHQEKIKLERKRERNRVAARKCRTRKLERISRLEDRVSDLKGQNSELVTTATTLRDQVAKLKSQIMEHVKSGCQVMMSQNLL